MAAVVDPLAVNGPVKCRAPLRAPVSDADVAGSGRLSPVRVTSVNWALPPSKITPAAGTSTNSSTTAVAPPTAVPSIVYGTSAYVMTPGLPFGAVVVGRPAMLPP